MDPVTPGDAVVLLEGGEATFGRILRRIGGAHRTITLRCFNWRDDATGEVLARALLAAADRGVRVTIFKDRVGAVYEYLETTRQSFLHKEIDAWTRLHTLLLALAYGKRNIRPSFAARPNPLASALLAHHRVTVHGDRRRFDHAKVYVIDDEILFVGGVGIGDDSRFANLDFMVEISGASHVARYHARSSDRERFDRTRTIDFLTHTAAIHGRTSCGLLAERLQLIRDARERLTIEMAYLGDPRITDALVEAVRCGVALTLVTGERSSVIGNLNLATCDQLLQRTGAPPRLRVVLLPQTVHSKVMVVDGRIVDLGSTNFTPLSHGIYDEVDVCIRDSRLAAQVEGAIERHAGAGRGVGQRVRFNRAYAFLERTFVDLQVRQGRNRSVDTGPVRKPAEHEDKVGL